MSQKNRILEELLRGVVITPLSALKYFGTLRLSERIRELEAEGVRIVHKMVRLENGKRVCSYRIANYGE